MKKIILIFILTIFTIACAAKKENEEVNMENDLSSKKVVLIIANQDFRDEEYAKPKEILENAGMKVVTAAKNFEIAKGKLGLEVMPDITIDKINVDEYDAVCFIGGSGCKVYWDDKIAHDIAISASYTKLLAAICAAPAILAYAGVLDGKFANSFNSERRILKEHGAKLVDKPVVVDGNIITANGPAAAEEFGETILKYLRGNNGDK